MHAAQLMTGAASTSVIRAPITQQGAARAPQMLIHRQRRVLGVPSAVLDQPGGGAGLLERPGLDRSQPDDGAPRTESGNSGADAIKGKILGGGNYRVLLVDHEKHTEDHCVTVLTRTIPGLSKEQAQNAFNTSRKLGVALVVSCLKEHAEFYASQLYRQGLKASIEPDTTTV